MHPPAMAQAIRLRRAPFAVLVVLLLLIPIGAAQPKGEKNEPPRVYEIRSVLEPPFNYYSVEAIDPEVVDLRYRWTIEGNGRCQGFTSQGARATWRHDDERNCPHDAGAHPGIIRVFVSDGVNEVERVYMGGSAPYDPGEPDWRVDGTIFFGGNETGDDPRDFDQPLIYGEDLDCPARDVSGAFEPVQSVWQDEDPAIFPDLAGKRLTIVSPRAITAELPLVAFKPTQLFGTRADRTAIYYNGTVTGSERVVAVARWTIHDAAGTRVLGEIDVGDMWIGGSTCGSAQPFNFKFDTTLGLALRHFMPAEDGDYTITMELAETGGPAVPGSEVVVSGKARVVHQPRLYFIGVTLRDHGRAPGELASYASAHSTLAKAYIPDYFPLPPEGLHAYSRPAERDLRSVAERAAATCDHHPGVSQFDWCFLDAVRSGIETSMARVAWQLRGAEDAPIPVDRIAVVVDGNDMDWLVPPVGAANGVAASSKVFFQRVGTTHYTTAHEFAHTIPRFAWLNGDPACTIDYHNKGGARGHGFRLTENGVPVRIPQGPILGLMGGGGEPRWIEQCTYQHLLANFLALNDPTLVGVAGWLAKDGEFEAAEFEPGMTFDGIPDREPGGEGRFAILLLDADGATLAEHRFDHPFVDSNGDARRLVSFSMAIERPAGLARIQLVGETGVLAMMDVTPNAPTLALTAPAAGAAAKPGEPLRVAWAASDPDGDALTYGVAWSVDDGETWFDVDSDITGNETLVSRAFVDAGDRHRVRVTATDGVNSAMVERTLGFFATPSPPPPPRTPEGAADAGAVERAESPGLGSLALLFTVAALALRRARR